jgi:dipeptidyl aminopeptidase/acylaminoacyl peptidase
VVDQETFANLGYGEKDVASSISDGTQMGYPLGAPFTRLLKGSGEEVYWMENGFRRHIPDMDTFRQLGYRPEDIFLVSDELLRSWPPGESLPSVLGTPPEPIPPLSEERVVLSYRPFDRIHHASELYTVYADGRNPRRLSYTTGYTWQAGATWSPDGRSIAFVQGLANFNEPSKPFYEIFITDPDRWTPKRLAESGLISDLVWSPDGTRLAFTQGLSSTVVMDMASGDLQPVAVEGWTIAWTPDGRIAFWVKGDEATEQFRLMIMDADGQNVQPVEAQITVFDQRYFPWRQCDWVASEPPY